MNDHDITGINFDNNPSESQVLSYRQIKPLSTTGYLEGEVHVDAEIYRPRDLTFRVTSISINFPNIYIVFIIIEATKSGQYAFEIVDRDVETNHIIILPRHGIDPVAVIKQL